MSVNSRFKVTKIIVQSNAFYRQRIPGSSSARKETVDIDILVTSTNGHRKIMQSIRIISRPPSRKRKWNQLSQFGRTSTKVIPTEKTEAGHISTKSQGPAVLHICFCSLSNNSKQQLGAPAQTWQQYFIHGRMVDL